MGEQVIQSRKSTSCVRVYESRAYPVFNHRRVDSFAHLQHTRIAVTFARWNLLLPAAKKKQERRKIIESLKQN